MAAIDDPSAQRFYHGTRADLKPGDLIEPGYNSTYGKRKKAAYVYLTATLDAATWGAELALGEAPGRIYMVEPTGPIMDDPNLTDKKHHMTAAYPNHLWARKKTYELLCAWFSGYRQNKTLTCRG
jgi:hypothetical protein